MIWKPATIVIGCVEASPGMVRGNKMRGRIRKVSKDGKRNGNTPTLETNYTAL